MLSKMLKARVKKTKSVLKDASYLAVFLALFGFVAISLWLLDGNFTKETTSKKASSSKACLTIHLKNNNSEDCLAYLEHANTNEKRIRGLSGRSGLADNAGMLFTFETSGQQCFWMKDMNFSIDIIWLNDKKEIIKILPEVSPDTYPSSFCADQTKYVVELPAGAARQADMDIGDRLKF